MSTKDNTITEDNYTYSYYSFEDRQSGISLVYSLEKKAYLYNVYCIEQTLLKELFTVEYDFLDDAIETVNSEFGSWNLKTFEEKKSSCSSCQAH